MQDRMQGGMHERRLREASFTAGRGGGTQPLPNAVHRARRLSRLMDSSIPLPGTSFRIGLDPILGLLPGVGDVIASLMSGYIVILAMEAGASSWTLARMVGNIALESTLGAVPVVGDLFDAVWKSNERNHRLLEENLRRGSTKKADRLVVVLVGVALAAFTAFTIWLAVLFIKWLIAQI